MLQIILYGLGDGMSGSWWRNQHNKHHATPQKMKHDSDLNTLPLVAFHKEVVPKNYAGKLWLKMQSLLFLPVIAPLVAHGWQKFLHPRHMLRTGHYEEFATIIMRYGFIAYLGYLYGFGLVFQRYLFYIAIGASYIFTNFAVSHTHRDVVPENKHANWVEYSANHTSNCSPTWWCNWWMSYLNFQIEHHLFPSMPQFRHPLIYKRVKALFEKHNMVYDQRNYFVLMGVTFKNLWDVGHFDHHDHYD